jgi:hypothetical protein
LFYGEAATNEKFPHIFLQDEAVECFTDETEGRSHHHPVCHNGGAVFLLENVLVAQFFKGTAEHPVGEFIWAVELDDARGKIPSKSEVTR